MRLKCLSILACVFAFILGGTITAAESGPVINGKTVVKGKKNDCPKYCELRAKAALALSATKEVKTIAVAPAPKEKTKGKDCGCGDNCTCPPGVCPDCPTTTKGTVPTPTVTYFQRGNVIYECSGGSCRPIGTAGIK